MSCYLGIWRTDSSTCVVWVAQDLCSKLSDCAMILLSCSIIPSVASVARRWSVHAILPSLLHLHLSKQKTAGPLLTTHTHIQARQKHAHARYCMFHHLFNHASRACRRPIGVRWFSCDSSRILVHLFALCLLHRCCVRFFALAHFSIMFLVSLPRFPITSPEKRPKSLLTSQPVATCHAPPNSICLPLIILSTLAPPLPVPRGPLRKVFPLPDHNQLTARKIVKHRPLHHK